MLNTDAIARAEQAEAAENIERRRRIEAELRAIELEQELAAEIEARIRAEQTAADLADLLARTNARAM